MDWKNVVGAIAPWVGYNSRITCGLEPRCHKALISQDKDLAVSPPLNLSPARKTKNDDGSYVVTAAVSRLYRQTNSEAGTHKAAGASSLKQPAPTAQRIGATGGGTVGQTQRTGRGLPCGNDAVKGTQTRSGTGGVVSKSVRVGTLSKRFSKTWAKGPPAPRLIGSKTTGITSRTIAGGRLRRHSNETARTPLS